MSHGKLREDKTCLNCGHTVEEKFCPHCGQENTEPRQPFHYLFTHFIEDFTHYDGQFWKTLKYLMTRPGQLTKEYIAGKRQIYVAPVKLYIFISFVTFLLPSFLPDGENHKEPKITAAEQRQTEQETAKQTLETLRKEGILSVESTEKAKKKIDKKNTDSTFSEDGLFDRTFDKDNSKILGASNLKEYDSLHQKNGSALYTISRPFAKKTFELKEKEGLNKEEIKKRFIETFIHTLPKALFIYLPIFAFFLWIFHNKKKWWYFDHGIFTLHYFSFLLLCILIFMVKDSLISLLPGYSIIGVLNSLASVILFFYLCIYFFIAHHRVYETRKRISILKGILLFILNSFGLFIMLLALVSTSFLMIH